MTQRLRLQTRQLRGLTAVNNPAADSKPVRQHGLLEQRQVLSVSGAMIREEYLKCIEDVGFQGVKVSDKTRFPFDILVDDPTAKKIVADAQLTSDEAKEIAGSIISLKVQADKAKRTSMNRSASASTSSTKFQSEPEEGELSPR